MALGKVAKKYLGGAFATRVTLSLDRRILLWPRLWRTDGSRHVLIVSPSGSNIGDQAMVDSFLEAVPPGTGCVVIPAAAEYTVPADAESVYLRTILRQHPRRFRDVLRLRHVLAGARSMSIIGADIMDGSYNNRNAVVTWNLARVGARSGLPTAVLGFSWDSPASPAVADGARRATGAGVRLVARDPHSLHRLSEVGVSAVQGSDMVFAAAAQSPVPLRLDEGEHSQRPIALVNASALIEKRHGLFETFVELVKHLDGLGYRVILLPHVGTSHSNDIDLADRLRLKAGPFAGEDDVIDRLLAPSQIRHLASMATLVVTGRMHLGVISLSQGTPSIVLSTQGKVTGLMELFEAPQWAVEPGPGTLHAVIEAVRDIHADPAAARTQVLRHLPAVKKLANRNFEHLRSEGVGGSSGVHGGVRHGRTRRNPA